MKSLLHGEATMQAITIIVPVKDEQVGLQYLLNDYNSSRLKDLFDVRFIFVIDVRTDDSSKDFASKFSDKIIDQRETTGKGAAIRQAVDFWLMQTTSKVIFLDADGSYSFDSVLRVLEELDAGADVVSGSRFISSKGRPEGMSRLHNFGNRFLSKVSSIRNGRRITDLCTGLWGFQESSLMKLKISSKGFDLEAEIAGLVRKNNLIHKEVGVEWSQRKGGTSKLRSIRDGSLIFYRIIMT